MSPVIEATVQAATLSAVSNLLAQSIKSYTESKPFVFDFTPVIQFVVFTILSTPPNFLWQLQLESWYPSQVPVEQKTEKENSAVKTKLSKSNIIKKFAIDQLLGAPINTVLFLAFMGYMRGFTGDALKTYVIEEFWPLTSAGLKLWPAVSLISFAVIPADKRIIFGSIIALGWNIFLGLTL
ncbi:hypothetical protein BZA77DRAFT_326612 [Pyronema omphalodes]|nr:hypothetical protein BZA77DRAFT_326612 [Pyronema omphalodes]